MKRAPELVPLSHDHHRALYVAMLLTRATEEEPARTEAISFWFEAGLKHLAVEEDTLLPGWLFRDPEADREPAMRVLREHLELRIRFLGLQDGSASLSEMNELGRILEAHVRFEERELFPHIEARLDVDAIAALGSEIAERAKANAA